MGPTAFPTGTMVPTAVPSSTPTPTPTFLPTPAPTTLAPTLLVLGTIAQRPIFVAQPRQDCDTRTQHYLLHIAIARKKPPCTINQALTAQPMQQPFAVIIQQPTFLQQPEVPPC